MSYTEYKSVIRVEIKELAGADKNAAYNCFKNILGDPDNLDEWDGEVEWFSYKDDEGEIAPVYDYHNKKWGVDYVLLHSDDYKRSSSSLDMPVSQIKSFCDILCEKFGVNEEDCKLVSYDWYNGGDEPIWL